MAESSSFSDITLSTVGAPKCYNYPSIRVPSNLLCLDGDNSLMHCEPVTWSYIDCPSPPPPTSAPTTSDWGDETQVCGTARYKMMGLASKETAMQQLDTDSQAVLFHDEAGRLLLALQSAGTKFLLRVKMQIYPNGDRYWGVEDGNRQMCVAFKNKERLLQFYALCPQAAVMSYFDV